MSTVLNFLGHGLALAAGMTIASFFLIQALICLFFALPFTMRLKKDFAFLGKPPTLRYIAAPIFLLSLFVLASWGIHSWFPARIIFYWIGVGWILFFGIGRCFGNVTNMNEYLSQNEDVLLPNVVEELRNGTYFR
jgi:hypothetical protein